MESKDQPSRRALLKGATVAGFATVAAGCVSASPVVSARARSPSKTLLKGGIIISMDPDVGDIARGDILIDGAKIAAIGRDLAVGDAEVVDASNRIVIPGFIDCHRHSWEGQLRMIDPNAGNMDGYMNATHLSFGTYYRPEDMHVGNLMTAVGCIDAGITCLIDNSHNARSAAHSDAAIEALMASGIRAVHASGGPVAGEWAQDWPADLERMKARYFSSDDQLLTLGMYSRANEERYAIARRLGIRIYSELGVGHLPVFEDLGARNLIGPDNTFNHCSGLTESAWRVLAASGAKVNLTPRSDAQWAIGEGFPPYDQSVAHRIAPGLSIDNETAYSTDMFGEMRALFFIQRARLQNRRFEGATDIPAPIGIRETLACGTINGAACAGLSHKIGSLTVGKEADIVLIDADAPNMFPLTNALGAVVHAADRSNVDSVMVAGRFLKRDGRILHQDLGQLKRSAQASLDYLFAKVGHRPDIFSAGLPVFQ